MRQHPPWFILAISLWLWFTVLFANFAEAMAEGRGKAQADSLRKARKDIHARRLLEARRDATTEATVVASQLRKGDHVLVEAGSIRPWRARGRSSMASRRSTRVRSPERAPPSSASAAATGAR